MNKISIVLANRCRQKEKKSKLNNNCPIRNIFQLICLIICTKKPYGSEKAYPTGMIDIYYYNSHAEIVVDKKGSKILHFHEQ